MIWNLKSDAEDYQSSGKKRRLKDKCLKYGSETCFQCLECDRLFQNKASLYSHWNTVHIKFGKLYKKSEDWPKRVREIDRETFERLNQLSKSRLGENKSWSGELVEETLPRNRFFNYLSYQLVGKSNWKRWLSEKIQCKTYTVSVAYS